MEHEQQPGKPPPEVIDDPKKVGPWSPGLPPHRRLGAVLPRPQGGARRRRWPSACPTRPGPVARIGSPWPRPVPAEKSAGSTRSSPYRPRREGGGGRPRAREEDESESSRGRGRARRPAAHRGDRLVAGGGGPGGGGFVPGAGAGRPGVGASGVGPGTPAGDAGRAPDQGRARGVRWLRGRALRSDRGTTSGAASAGVGRARRSRPGASAHLQRRPGVAGARRWRRAPGRRRGNRPPLAEARSDSKAATEAPGGGRRLDNGPGPGGPGGLAVTAKKAQGVEQDAPGPQTASYRTGVVMNRGRGEEGRRRSPRVCGPAQGRLGRGKPRPSSGFAGPRDPGGRASSSGT